VQDPAASGRELARQLHAAGGAGILAELREALAHKNSSTESAT
jgi:hypothetical protein